MKYVLLWLAISPAGSITSGSAQFDDRVACQTAGAHLVVNAGDMRGKDKGGFDLIFECEPARSKD